MKQLDSEVPLPRRKKALHVCVVYNVKKGVKTAVPDDEAEYDNIETVYAIKSALEVEGHQVSLLEANEALPEKLRKKHIDIVFNIAEGLHGRGREAQVPAILNYLGIPFTGSDETTLCLALDKALTKRLLSSYRIRTPKSILLSTEASPLNSSLQYPVIIKPNAEGSSKGISNISIVKSSKELREVIKRNFGLYKQAMLAEEYIEGREFTVGILGNGEETKVFPPMEIIYKKGTQESYHVYSYEVKQNYQAYVNYQCPAELTKEQETEMTNMARKIYNILGCRDFSRLDFRMSPQGKIFFLEINPLPGLAPGYSDYPMLAEFCGMSYTELVNSILKAAIKRLQSRTEMTYCDTK